LQPEVAVYLKIRPIFPEERIFLCKSRYSDNQTCHIRLLLFCKIAVFSLLLRFLNRKRGKLFPSLFIFFYKIPL